MGRSQVLFNQRHKVRRGGGGGGRGRGSSSDGNVTTSSNRTGSTSIDRPSGPRGGDVSDASSSIGGSNLRGNSTSRNKTLSSSETTTTTNTISPDFRNDDNCEEMNGISNEQSLQTTSKNDKYNIHMGTTSNIDDDYTASLMTTTNATSLYVSQLPTTSMKNDFVHAWDSVLLASSSIAMNHGNSTNDWQVIGKNISFALEQQCSFSEQFRIPQYYMETIYGTNVHDARNIETTANTTNPAEKQPVTLSTSIPPIIPPSALELHDDTNVQIPISSHLSRHASIENQPKRQQHHPPVIRIPAVMSTKSSTIMIAASDDTVTTNDTNTTDSNTTTTTIIGKQSHRNTVRTTTTTHTSRSIISGMQQPQSISKMFSTDSGTILITAPSDDTVVTSNTTETNATMNVAGGSGHSTAYRRRVGNVTSSDGGTSYDQNTTTPMAVAPARSSTRTSTNTAPQYHQPPNSNLIDKGVEVTDLTCVGSASSSGSIDVPGDVVYLGTKSPNRSSTNRIEDIEDEEDLDSWLDSVIS
jgi:hypothetical protein